MLLWVSDSWGLSDCLVSDNCVAELPGASYTRHSHKRRQTGRVLNFWEKTSRLGTGGRGGGSSASEIVCFLFVAL